jgi:hypothetical protein
MLISNKFNIKNKMKIKKKIKKLNKNIILINSSLQEKVQ